MKSISIKQHAINFVTDAIKEEILESVKSHTIYPKVQPKVGSIVHCSLYGVQHSGVYIGENTIVQLECSGNITAVNPSDFVKNTTALAIYVACDSNNNVLYSQKIAQNAVHQIGQKLNYNVLVNNCHKFTAGCILGDFNNLNLTFSSLKAVIKNYFFDQQNISLLQPFVNKFINLADSLNLTEKNQNLYSIKIPKKPFSNNNNNNGINTQSNTDNQELRWLIWDNEITPKSSVKRIANKVNSKIDEVKKLRIKK